jgi:hypothetical protein
VATLDDIRALGYTVQDTGSVLEVVGFDLRFLIDPADQEAIDALANPALHEQRTRRPQPKVLTEVENEKVLRDRAALALGPLKNALENWATLTDAQKDTTLRISTRCVVDILRILFRDLEETT